MFSVPHLIVIFVVALIIFGPEKLPELARSLGKVMGEFRRATGDLQSTFEGHLRDIERDADARRIGGAQSGTASPSDGQSSGVPGDAGSPNAPLPATSADEHGQGGPNVSAAAGIVPSKPPNAAALTEQRGLDLFSGNESEHIEIGNSGSHSAVVPPEGSSEPEHPYDHVSDAGFRQS